MNIIDAINKYDEIVLPSNPDWVIDTTCPQNTSTLSIGELKSTQWKQHKVSFCKEICAKLDEVRESVGMSCEDIEFRASVIDKIKERLIDELPEEMK